MSNTKVAFRCKMLQLLVNFNDATTGHKLQGMSKVGVALINFSTVSLPYPPNIPRFILLPLASQNKITRGDGKTLGLFTPSQRQIWPYHLCNIIPL